jgi:hypothetical protein
MEVGSRRGCEEGPEPQKKKLYSAKSLMGVALR